MNPGAEMTVLHGAGRRSCAGLGIAKTARVITRLASWLRSDIAMLSDSQPGLKCVRAQGLWVMSNRASVPQVPFFSTIARVCTRRGSGDLRADRQ